MQDVDIERIMGSRVKNSQEVLESDTVLGLVFHDLGRLNESVKPSDLSIEEFQQDYYTRSVGVHISNKTVDMKMEYTIDTKPGRRIDNISDLEKDD